MNAEIIDPCHPEMFVSQWRAERRKYPLSPLPSRQSVLIDEHTASDIDMSGIFRMTPDQIDEALLLAVA